MASLSLKHIYKIYQGGVKAVSDFNLEIDDKEFVVFVGPSGCGKSTTLRMVAGLEEISAGELYIDGVLVNDVEPKDRDIAMVFQNYALYPHMTVYDNMAFGLRLRKMNPKEIDSRVQEAAAILGITQLLTRKPKALSGGQRQRVALGRAIVREPKVFLLDEPLSNLDAKLRVQMRTEITKLHNKLATTFIYVTHDQTEAMTMGTRIVVMKDGIVQQVDTPQCLYDNPDNLFVASFLGSPQMNFFNAVITEENGKTFASFGTNKIEIPQTRARRILDRSFIGKSVVLGVRPEDIHDEEIFITGSPETVITAEIDVIEKLGNETILYMKVDGKEDYAVARIDARSTANAGETINLAIDAKHIHLFDPVTELSIMGVPRMNRINAKLLGEKGSEPVLVVRFGNTKITLNDSLASRIADRSKFNDDVVLEIAPSDLMAREALTDVASPDEDSNYFSIEGTVAFVEKYPRYTAAYVEVEGKDSYIVAKFPLDSNVSYGNKVKLYGLVEAIQLRDVKTNNKIVASSAVSDNTALANITVKENVASINFGKSKLCMASNDTIRDNGTRNIHIGLSAFTINKAEIAKNPKMVLVGKVMNADLMGDHSIVYATVEGINGYLTAKVTDQITHNIGDKIKLGVNSLLVSAEAPQSLAEAIAEAADTAPEYVFVPTKKVEKPAPKKEASDETAATTTETAEVTEAAPEAPAKKPAAKKPTAEKPAAKKPATKKPVAKK